MTKTKMTHREILVAISAITEIAENPIYSEFVANEIDKLDRRSSSGKLTPKQADNVILKQEILDAMEDDELYTISDMLKLFECCASLSNQKVSALVRQLIEAGSVEKVVEKRTSFFKKV